MSIDWRLTIVELLVVLLLCSTPAWKRLLPGLVVAWLRFGWRRATCGICRGRAVVDHPRHGKYCAACYALVVSTVKTKEPHA